MKKHAEFQKNCMLGTWIFLGVKKKFFWRKITKNFILVKFFFCSKMTNIDTIWMVYQEKFGIFCLYGLLEVIEQELDQSWAFYFFEAASEAALLTSGFWYSTHKFVWSIWLKCHRLFFKMQKKVGDAMFLIRKELLLLKSFLLFSRVWFIFIKETSYLLSTVNLISVSYLKLRQIT